MKKYIIGVMTLFILFTTTQCTKVETGTIIKNCTDGSANYPWLGVGHELHYAYAGFNGDDSMIIKVLSNPSPGTYRTEISFKPSGKSDIVYYHACGKDLYTSHNGNYLEYEHWWFSLNSNVGDFWSRSTPGILYTYQLDAKNITVRTSFLHQTFTNCYKFTAKNPLGNGIDTIYFKTDAGVVFYDGVNGQYELVYKNYNIPQTVLSPVLN
jgi:hypothetical protein